MVGVPERTEAAPYYFTYIDRITSGDIIGKLETQLEEASSFLRGISEERSLFRYAPDKWSMRQVWSHVNDAERVFVFRALWFARGFVNPLPSFEQDIAVDGAQADSIPWARHVDEFRSLRLATVAFFRNLPEDAWKRTGMASGNSFTVRAMAYIVAGHADHHLAILGERYR
ncbi:MAG: DinB family protein [Candidatus Binatia bacterium]